MRISVKTTLLLIPIFALPFFTGGCAAPVHKESVEKYPRKPADNPERKSGLPMLFYEAAEEDADPNNIIVTPPAEKKDAQ